jgi:UDP-N-acetylmuramoyl-L-alanyl-D-glutamate--2,6-diaminopimelate ligase
VDCEITDIKNDSRSVGPGDLFIAYPGALTDGRLFIEKAVASGASAIVYEPEHMPCQLPGTIPCVALPHLAERLAELAQRFYHNPSSSLVVTGVTGTNGKTTIAYQLAQAHSLLQDKAAYIGTIGQGDVEDLKPQDNTTPDALCLQRLLKQYHEQGIKQVCMEVSSHALCLHRVEGIQFKQALFTNLTLDHLDYHLTMEAYADAKAQLFANEYLECVIVNHDDAYSKRMLFAVKPQVKKITYGLSPDADVRAVDWEMTIAGIIMNVVSPWGQHQLKINAIGQFNIYNSLAVFSSLMVSGYPAQQVIKILTQLKAAPGRMEIVAQSPYVLVDYAHTPDALENVLSTLSQLKKGNLWVIFGCGGDRDKSKRPIMGKAAALHADRIIVTSDNPRSEDPEQIINDIIQGIPNSNQITKLSNREEAITFALKHAKEQDIILIAGKGHEAYQQIGSIKHVFSDRDVVRKILSSM